MKTTRKEVEDIIGEVDELVLAKILAVGASREELLEAALVAVMDYEMGEQVSPPSNTRVDALAAIIEALLADGDEYPLRDDEARFFAMPTPQDEQW